MTNTNGSSYYHTAKEDHPTVSSYYTIGITGSTGLLGTAFIQHLARQQLLHDTSTFRLDGKPIRIIRFQRSTSKQVQEISTLPPIITSSTTTATIPIHSIPWNPYGTSQETNNDWCIHPNIIRQLDAIIHLAGENVATSTFLPGPLQDLGLHAWTKEKKQEIIRSRVEPTQNLAKAIYFASLQKQQSHHQPQQQVEKEEEKNHKHPTFIVASGIGIYGYHYHQTNTPLSLTNDYHTINDEENTQVTQNSQGFLAHVSRVWEEASRSGGMIAGDTTTSSSSITTLLPRIVQLRLAPILSTKGGALSKLLPIFTLGGGGILGSGTQYFSFISATDVSRAILHILQSSSIEGPVNVVAPIPCTNYEFTKTLGNVLSRPTWIPMPTLLVKLLFGEMGQEMLVGGVVACPKKLLQSGFVFHHPTIEEALTSAIREESRN